MDRKSLFHISPGRVEVRAEPIPEVGPGQLLVQSLLSAISSGTEMLLYRGQFPQALTLDENIPSLSGAVKYPLKYGYSLVGEVIRAGENVEDDWIGKKVFAFHPHTSHFVTEPHNLQVIPEDLTLEDAVFLPNMETAVSLVMDGAPVIGERVVVFGQGVVGLLTTALLSNFPLENLVSIDRYDLRRRVSLDLGASQSVDPADGELFESIDQGQGDQSSHRADLVYELTGSPEVLDHAIHAVDYEGRIVLGSWYGKKRANIDLGGWFHRGRIKIISSQVSRIGSPFSSRWDKRRRFQLAWKMLKQINPSKLITHEFPIQNAGKAFQMLDENPGEVLQVTFKY